VLLGVDRALTCRNCWYRILLDVYEKENPNKKDSDTGKSE
jgi:DNA-directed RNA polymerase subunit RPC12/RpoP